MEVEGQNCSEEHAEHVENGKKIRRRKKHLYSSILKQMEFYFSDANIRKDRFIAQLIQSNPYVDLTVFLKFNKILALTNKVEDIATALEKSTMLRLSEDQGSVCRVTGLRAKGDEEGCTVYVERLPEDAAHDWLSEIFAVFGPVDYVSLPRYKHNRRHKGFAFIEFRDPESAQKALTYFESIGCKLPTQMPPGQLASILTFEAENINNTIQTQDQSEQTETNEQQSQTDKQQTVQTDEQMEQETKEPLTEETNDENINIQQNTVSSEDKKCAEEKGGRKKKRKLEGEGEVESKKVKCGKEVKEEKMEEEVEVKEKKVKKEKVEVKEEEVEKEKEGEESETKVSDKEEESGMDVSKRKRKRKKSKKNCDFTQMGFQVLSKREWKQLRNKYLNMQRIKMKCLKQQLSRGAAPPADLAPTQPQSQSQTRVTFTPRCIVQLTVPSTYTDVKKLKSDIRLHAGVEYIDAETGKELCWVRFSGSDAARGFCEGWEGAEVVAGPAEADYWRKIHADRAAKLARDHSRPKQPRGRDRLIKRAELELGKHIRFDTVT